MEKEYIWQYALPQKLSSNIYRAKIKMRVVWNGWLNSRPLNTWRQTSGLTVKSINVGLSVLKEFYSLNLEAAW